MFTTIACTSCGLPLGDRAPIYIKIAHDRMLKMFEGREYEITPNALMADSRDVGNMMKDIADGLQIDLCCLMHQITAVQFFEHY